MITKNDFASYTYEEKKEYLISILSDISDKFKLSKIILKLLHNHSPSDTFLISTFNQLEIMEQEWKKVLDLKDKEHIIHLNNIAENFDELSDKEKNEAETDLIKNLANI